MTASVTGVRPFNRDYTEGSDGTIELSLVYLLQTTDKLDGPLTVMACTELPAPGSPYSYGNESDDTLIVSRRVPRQMQDDPQTWEATITWSRIPIGSVGFGTGTFAIPLPSQPADVEVDAESQQVPCYGSFGVNDGIENPAPNPFTSDIKSSAGEIFDPPPMKEESHPVIRITRWEESPNWVDLFSYANTVNSDNVLGCPADTLKMRPIRGRRQYADGQYQWQMTYEMEYNALGWTLKILDQGTLHWPSGDDKSDRSTRVPFQDAEGNVVTGNLNGNGFPLEATAPPEWLEFEIYEQKAFAPLGLEAEI